jgi:hypothetical protein
MTYLIKGNKYKKTHFSERCDVLPSGIYILEGESISDYTLIRRDRFDVPKKVYGDINITIDRYLNTFRKREGNTNVLLYGDKGNGKSLLAKMLCNESNLPCIIVSRYLKDFSFIMNEIYDECIVLIDEFDKVYDTEEKQAELLTLLDGVFQSKKMFVFTSNKYNLNKFLKNRPGRIYYYKDFNNVSRDLAEEVIDDKLNLVEYKDEMLKLVDVMGNMNIDTLLTVIEEVDRYKESPLDVCEYLNISFENVMYNFTLILGGKKYLGVFNGHPLKNEKVILSYKKDEERNWWRVEEEEFTLAEFEIDFPDDNTIEMRSIKSHDLIIFRKMNKENKVSKEIIKL